MQFKGTEEKRAKRERNSKRGGTLRRMAGFGSPVMVLMKEGTYLTLYPGRGEQHR
jgi:hypothetical protein